jgi:hypothetical protein
VGASMFLPGQLIQSKKCYYKNSTLPRPIIFVEEMRDV